MTGLLVAAAAGLELRLIEMQPPVRRDAERLELVVLGWHVSLRRCL